MIFLSVCWKHPLYLEFWRFACASILFMNRLCSWIDRSPRFENQLEHNHICKVLLFSLLERWFMYTFVIISTYLVSSFLSTNPETLDKKTIVSEQFSFFLDFEWEQSCSVKSWYLIKYWNNIYNQQNVNGTCFIRI